MSSSPPPIDATRVDGTRTDEPRANLPQLVSSLGAVAPRQETAVDSIAPPAGPSPTAILHSMRRRWLLAGALGVLCSVACGAAAWFWFEPEFRSSALFRVSANEPRMVFTTADNAGQQNFDIYKRTQRELIRGRFVLNAALRNDIGTVDFINEQLDPVDWLEKHVEVDFPGDAELMRISLSGNDPDSLAKLVNAVSDAYRKEVVEVEKMNRTARLNELERIQKESEEKLRSRQGDLRRLAEALGSGDVQALSAKQQLTLQQYAALRSEYTRVQFDLMRAQIEMAALENSPAADDPAPAAAGPSAALIEDQLEHHSEVAPLKARFDSLAKAIKNYGEVATAKVKNRTAIKKLEKDLSEVEEELQEAKDKYRPIVRELLAGRQSARQDDALGQLQRRVAILTEQERRLRDDTERFGKEAEQIGKSSVEVEMMRSELKQIGSMNDQLAKEIESLRVELRSPTRVVLLQKAEVPKVRERRKQINSTATIALLGLLLPGLGISLLDASARLVNSSQDLERNLKVRVIGSLPLVPDRIRNSDETSPLRHRIIQRGYHDSLDTLRTVLSKSPDLGTPQVVMVTSAFGGEGKTTLATELSRSFARAGRKTLLIDFDLRRPAAHVLFDLENERGMCEVLQGSADIDDVIQSTSDGVDVVSGGHCCEESLFGLSNNHDLLVQCFRDLRSRYDNIVVDTSPVLPVVDALLVGEHCDAAIVSVLRDVSQLHKIEAAAQRLASIGIKVLGAVVACKASDSYYGHAYYHSSVEA